MSLARLLSSYFALNLLVVLGFVGLWAFSNLTKKLGIAIKARTELKLHYSILSILVALIFALPFFPRNEIFSPAAKVWSAQSIRDFGQQYSAPDQGGYLIVPTPSGTSVLPSDRVTAIWIVLGILLFASGTVLIARDLHSLLKIKDKAFLIRKIGHVRIFLSDDIQVPFCYWLPFQANLVIPSYLIEKPKDYKIAIAHELQHHRHGDTRWVYMMWLLRMICIFNPAIHLWSRWISEIQEFACDETLVDQNKVESQAYARCLVEVAQTVIHQKYVPVCATGLTFLVERNLLKRRIEKMLSRTSKTTGQSISVAAGIVMAVMMAATAYASTGVVQDRRVTLSQANAMAAKVKSQTGFPIVVNDLVLKQLNRYIGTPEGRDFMKNSLQRMGNYKATVASYFTKYGAPAELMAVPIVESGYQNLTQEQSGTPMKAAGLWQFIPTTARNLGLHVDDKQDERLDVGLNTDAALRLLQADKLRFNDWQLSVLAYNMGEVAVQNAMAATGSRDAWTLIRKGYEGDKDYLPRVMAAILIMNNPESVE